MDIVLIGGTGFLGRHICEALEHRGRGATVISFRPDHRFLAKHAPLSVALQFGTEEADAALAQAETILHFGHRSYPGSNLAAEVREVDQNIQPAIHLLSQLANTNPGAHVVYASTGGQIYGPAHTLPIPETAPAQPVTPYAFGKHVIEEGLRYYAHQDVLRATILRIGNPVGRWQLGGPHGFVSAAVEAAISGRPLTLFGPGQKVRDYFDARDLAAFIADLALDKTRPQGTFNIGSGIGLTETEVLALVDETLGIQVTLDHRPARSFDLPYAVLDAKRARTELGWLPKIPLADTIRDISNWITPPFS